MAAGIMRTFKINEISAVDRPAQAHATLAIIKRDAGPGPYVAKRADESPLPEHVEAYLKRDFSDDKRKELAGTGAALPDGSFPIENRADLRNAVRAIGRAKNPARAKAHIISRARSLGAMSSLPDGWNVGKMLKSVTNADAVAGFQIACDTFTKEQTDAGVPADAALEKSKELANALLAETGDCVLALKAVADEIAEDPEVTNKSEALQDSFSQFKAHMKGIIPEGIENGLVVAALAESGFGVEGGGALVKRETDMGFDIKKSLGLPATATDADVEKAVELNSRGAALSLAILKMSNKHTAFMQNEKAKMPKGGKEAFASMSPAERDEHMASNPCEPDAAEKAAALKAATALLKAAGKTVVDEDEDEEKDANKCIKVGGRLIRKSVVGEDMFAVVKSQQADLAKHAETEAVATFAKRADTSMSLIGKSDELATLLRSVQKTAGDTVAEAVAKKFEQLNEVIKKGGGTLFTEIGAGGQHGAFSKAKDQIETLAQKMVSEGKAKTIFKARDMVRMQNPDLKKAEDAEANEAREAAKSGRRAA